MLNNYKTKLNNKGAALLAVISMFAFLFPITLGLLVLVTNEIKRARDFEFSSKALSAAESGIEHALYKIRTEAVSRGDHNGPYIEYCAIDGIEGTSYIESDVSCDIERQTVSGRATYRVDIVNCYPPLPDIATDPEKEAIIDEIKEVHDWCCDNGGEPTIRCIRSTGSYQNANRALQINF